MKIRNTDVGHGNRAGHGGWLCAAMLAWLAQAATAQSLGVSSQGNSGGLVIPSAQVLSAGTLAFSYGNYQEPQLGARSTHQNFSLGVGLFQNFELFGRFADYTDPLPDTILFSGIRDISANIKWQLPMPWAGGPKLALGVNDMSGGAVFFKSGYLVASDQYGPLAVSLGYARGDAGLAGKPTFDGPFGGAALRLGDSGVSALAEYDGQQKHAGLRWQSPAFESLGRAQLVGTVQRSFGALTPAGLDANATRLALSLMLPFGDNAARVAQAKPDPATTLPPLDARPPSGGMQPSADDRLASLRAALVKAGLERVRVGLREGVLGSTVVVEYENHRYAQNEADALGLVLGLSAELAPRGTQRALAVTLKDGFRLYETSVGVPAYRAFLRNGPASHVRDSLIWERAASEAGAGTRWIDAEASPASRLRIEIKPNVNFALGTEIGAFDYALAANLQAIVPLWSGARALASYMLPLSNSVNMDEGAAYDSSRQRRQLNAVALQQSFSIGNLVLGNVAAGRFYNDVFGVQAEAAVFMPGSDDLLRLRGAGYNKAPGGLDGQDRALAASYRHMLSPTLWLEGGVQLYSDGSSGPTLELKRWFGDVGVQIFLRRGGSAQFAGLQLSFPLTPRQGMEPRAVVFGGAAQYTQGIRTKLTSAGAPANWVLPGAVRDLALETSLEVDQFNAGRMSRPYLLEQAGRMREAFFLYGKALVD